ncbi:uncharacterized protein Z519_08753 [Cladophialophora bantiana CBS 173.52]|uniref:Haloacid dehalogenase-like hydrolase n=1 Tax=Cladophialophora bantiana (strain ATCC 10958 / CBS 173.52 / CDC B-1940 / NIH 8579) TaxID=1442370 RepID=A0A0D2HJQ2_CLAB1|nr:uncharacterized protein Z519_08753 [Cladophialophora bantiana CBS 173.52]KIW90970.1 hypothetical protein Z519_08753 [Cladophialophora bantiana CBS 173.52]
MPTRREMNRVRVVLDWDGTLTERDTLHNVAAIGYRRNRHRDLVPWDQIVQAYLSDYAEHEAAYRPVKKDRGEITQESAWLASLREVEMRSVTRVRDAGIFADVTEQDIRVGAEDSVRRNEIQLRDGWDEVLSLAHHHPGDEVGDHHSSLVSIISVNWSAAFIRACLSAALGDVPSAMKSAADSLPILSNRLPCETPGDVSEPVSIRTSADKLAAFQNLRGKEDEEDGPVFYVGDSATDFDCLLAADVGICVRDEPMGSGQAALKESLERVGVEVLKLDLHTSTRDLKGVAGRGGGQWVKSSKRVVWWVSNLREVASFAEKLHNDLD